MVVLCLLSRINDDDCDPPVLRPDRRRHPDVGGRVGVGGQHRNHNGTLGKISTKGQIMDGMYPLQQTIRTLTYFVTVLS